MEEARGLNRRPIYRKIVDRRGREGIELDTVSANKAWEEQQEIDREAAMTSYELPGTGNRYAYEFSIRMVEGMAQKTIKRIDLLHLQEVILEQENYEGSFTIIANRYVNFKGEGDDVFMSTEQGKMPEGHTMVFEEQQ